MKLKKVCNLNLLKSRKYGIAVAMISVIIILLFVRFFVYNEKSAVTSEYIISTLEKGSELTTAKLHYKGLSEFEDGGGLPIINKSNFKMIYEATARAGIDVSKIEIDVNNVSKVVLLTIPKAEILDVKIDPSSIIYL